MTSGIEFQEAAEAPQIKIEITDARVDLDKATFEAPAKIEEGNIPAKIEEGNIQVAEKVQEQFTALVDVAADTSSADGRPETEDRVEKTVTPQAEDKQRATAGDALLLPTAPPAGSPETGTSTETGSKAETSSSNIAEGKDRESRDPSEQGNGSSQSHIDGPTLNEQLEMLESAQGGTVTLDDVAKAYKVNENEVSDQSNERTAAKPGDRSDTARPALEVSGHNLINFTAIAVEIEVGETQGGEADQPEKSPAGESFSDVDTSGLSKAADSMISAGGVTAPHIPAGSVIGAAISGVSQGAEGILADQSETSGATNDDQGAFSTNLGDYNYAAVEEQWSEFVAEIATGSIPADINAMVQNVMRESYLEQLDDLKFHADKVKHFNAQKKAVRDYLTDLRYQAAKLPVGEDLVVPITTTEVAEDGSQVEVESSITLSIEDIEAIETALDSSYAEDDTRSETALGEDTLQSFIPGPGSITVGRAEVEIGASINNDPGNQLEDFSIEDIDDLGEALTEAEARIDTLQDSIQDISDQIDAEEADISLLVKNIAELEISIAQNQDCISELHSYIQMLMDELKDMEDGDIRTTTSQILELNPDGGTYFLIENPVEMNYSEIQNEIENLKAMIIAVEVKIQESEEKIEENKAGIEQDKIKISGLKKELMEVQIEIAEVQQLIAQFQEQIAENRNNETK